MSRQMDDVRELVPSGRRAEPLGEVVSLVDALPSLLDVLPPERVAAARVALRVRTVRIRRGRWAATLDTGLVDRGIGFLVVRGALIRCVSAAHRTGAELLGPGDVLRPGQDIPVAPFDAYWRAIVDTQLALLDAPLARAAAAVSELTPALVASVTARTGAVARQLAIVQSQAVEDRIVALMRDLAERWGVATRDGIVLPEFLTHGTLSLLLGARRPSVTSAMVRLDRQGVVHRREDGRYVMPFENVFEVAAVP